MERIWLSDGREVEVISFAIASSGYMFIRVNMNMGEAYSFFSSGTEKITYFPEEENAISIGGFTELAYIVNETDCVRVALVRPMQIEGVN
jgi:hypothetical protein